jgi:flagellar basal body-associated protein FliL
MRDMEKTTITIIVVISIAILVGSLYGIIQIKKASAQESSNTGQSSVPVTHNILPETSNHATTLTPIHVTTTHHNVTAANLNNGKLGAVAAKPTINTVTSGANAANSAAHL